MSSLSTTTGDRVGRRDLGRWFPAVLLITFLMHAAVSAIRPMVSYRAIAVGADSLDLGIIASCFALLALVVAVPVGRWVDRRGESRVVVVGGACAIAATSLALIWIDTVWALALSQAILGLGQIMIIVGTQALVANAGDPRRRDGRFGAFTVVVSLGQLAGPALLAAGGANGITTEATSGGTTAVFLACLAMSGTALLVALTLKITPEHRFAGQTSIAAAPSPASSMAALRQVMAVPSMPRAMLASLTVLTSIDILAVYLPAYGEANDLSVETIGLLLAARAAASIASRLAMLPLLRLFGRRRLLVLSIALPALALVPFVFIDHLVVQYSAMVVVGLGLGLGQPVTLSWVASRAPREVRGTAIGVRLSGNRLGQIVLPVAVGALAGVTGLLTVFISLTVLLSVSAIVVWGGSLDDEPSEGRHPPPA